MVETSPINEKIHMYPQLDNEMHYRLNEISRIKDYFIAEICERETMS